MPASALPSPSKEPRSGAQLSALIARGDREALGEFYEVWFDRLFRQARSLTGRDEAFCLDVVQESMLRVARSIRPMQSDADLARWMNRVVHTAALDLLRRETRQRLRNHKSGVSDAVTAPQPDERIEWLRKQIADLPAEEHGLLWMRFVMGSTLAAAGEAVGMSGDAAHGRLRRVLGRLRAATGKQGKGGKP